MILKTLILLILFLFPFGELLRFQVGNHVALKPLDVVVGITAMWWIVLQIKNGKLQVQKLKKERFFLPLVLFASIGFCSLLINLTWLKQQEFFVSLLYLLRFVSYALLLPIVLQFDKEFKKKIAIFLLIDGLIILIFGYLQYFFYNSLKNLYYQGWDEHMHRMFSTFFDPNFAAAFFILFGIFLGGVLYKYKKISNTYKVFLSLVLLFTLIAIFLTFSRTGLISLMAGAIAFLFLIKKKRLIFFVFASVVLFGIIASPKFYDENMNLFREASSKARLANYEVAWRVFVDHPIIGVGFNSYRYTKGLYGLDHDWVDTPSHADAGVDNSYLFILATTGILGLFAYGMLWVNLLKKAFYLHRKKLQIGAVVVISSACALFVNAFFINSLFFASLMLWMWLIFGIYEDL